MPSTSRHTRVRPSRRHSHIQPTTSPSHSQRTYPTPSPSSSPISTTSTSSHTSHHQYFFPSTHANPATPSLCLTRPEFNRSAASAPVPVTSTATCASTASAATELLSRVARSRASPPRTPVPRDLTEKDSIELEEERRRKLLALRRDVRRTIEELEMEDKMKMGSAGEEWGEAMRYWQGSEYGKRGEFSNSIHST
jgi:hypothetical protein